MRPYMQIKVTLRKRHLTLILEVKEHDHLRTSFAPLCIFFK
jgi:hypothetical protein